MQWRKLARTKITSGRSRTRSMLCCGRRKVRNKEFHPRMHLLSVLSRTSVAIKIFNPHINSPSKTSPKRDFLSCIPTYNMTIWCITNKQAYSPLSCLLLKIQPFIQTRLKIYPRFADKGAAI